ncbi:MAG: hypothetical protein KGI80_01080 [Verrucomicrobiota bacterium]|nr:hypothetical protein [Verrucomicrobiota bacterium]
MRLFFLFIASYSFLFGMHTPTGPERKAIGIQTFTYYDESRERPVVVELWYPAKSSGKSPAIEGRNASFQTESKKPLILLSHGHRGTRSDLDWLAEELVATEGYLVAAIDHFGDTHQNFDLPRSLCFWDRALDFTFLLNQWEKEASVAPHIDFKKVGFVGYSMGGMTGLCLAGATASKVKETFTQLFGERQWPQELFDRFDFARAEGSFVDSRIQSFCLLCPAAYSYSTESLKKVAKPVGLVISVGDEVLPFQDHAVRLIRYLAPQKLKVLREEVSHYVFLARPPGGKEGEKVRGETTYFAREFFRETLRSGTLRGHVE